MSEYKGIPKLRDLKDYQMWAEMVTGHMQEKQLWEALQPPERGQDATSHIKGKQAKAELMKLLSEKLLMRCASYTDGQALWEGLKERFAAVSRVQLVSKDRELRNLRLQAGESIADLFSRAYSLNHFLESMDEGLSEQKLRLVIIDALPASWTATVQGLLTGPMDMTLDALEELLDDIGRRMPEMAVEGGAFAAGEPWQEQEASTRMLSLWVDRASSSGLPPPSHRARARCRFVPSI